MLSCYRLVDYEIYLKSFVLKNIYFFLYKQDYVVDFFGGVFFQSDFLNSDNAEILEEVEFKKKK